MKISIDRLTLCGNAKGSLEVFYENNEYIKNRGFAKYPYRDFITFLDGSILQIAELNVVRSGKVKQLRYEFNPNNKTYEKVHLSVLKMLKDAHCTRIDIAFDVFDVDMSNWKWIDQKGRPSNIWYDGKCKRETVYIGGKDSDLRLRIYDKAKEQKEKDREWWRVEVQLRGELAENYRLMSRKGNVNINPFDDVTPVLDGDFPELDIKKRAMVKYLLAYPSGFAELSTATRSQYRKIIAGLASWKCVDLKKTWNEKSSDVGSELESWYSFTTESML